MGCLVLLQRILEWVAISFSRRSSRLRIKLKSPALAGRLFTTEPPGKTKLRGDRVKSKQLTYITWFLARMELDEYWKESTPLLSLACVYGHFRIWIFKNNGFHICLSSLSLLYVHCIFPAEVSIFYTVYHICEKQSRNKDLKKMCLSWKGEDADMSLRIVFSIPKGKAHLGPEEEEEKCTHHREKGADRTWFPTIGGKERFFFFNWIDTRAE